MKSQEAAMRTSSPESTTHIEAPPTKAPGLPPGPGITDTPLFRYHVGMTSDPEATLESRAARVPLGRFLTPRDIAKAALYLSSDDSSGITGIAHVVAAGYLAAAEWDNRPL